MVTINGKENKSPIISYKSISSREDIEDLKYIHIVTLDAHYSERLYSEITSPDTHYYNKLAYDGGKVIGAILCRLDIADEYECEMHVHTIGVLEGYRRLGVATSLMDAAFREFGTIFWANSAVLEVHVENPAALRFYEKKGFHVDKVLPDYYRGEYPNSDAYYMRVLLNNYKYAI